MATFKDVNGREWLIDFDGLLLSDVLDETGLDLGDLSAGGLAAIEQSPIKLVKVLSVLCRDQSQRDKITDRQFSKAIRGDVFSKALTAVLEAAESFFPQSQWSDVQFRLENRRQFQTDWAKLQPLLQRLNEPEMDSLRPAILAAMTEMMGGMSSQNLDELISAGGQDVTPSSPVSASLESVESVPAA